MKLHAFVLHNVSTDMFFRYDPTTSNPVHAHTFQIEADNAEKAADLIWILTNVDSADDLRVRYPHLGQYADQVTHYRTRKNRSLSVGDVIVFFERERPAGAVSVAPFGFDDADIEHIDLRSVTNERVLSDAYAAYREFADTHNRTRS